MHADDEVCRIVALEGREAPRFGRPHRGRV